MISVQEAQSIIRAGVNPLGAETVALPNALHRVLAEDPAARIAHPAYTVSAMDGYAVSSKDITSSPKALLVIGESAAGHPYPGALESGQAIRIFTGAHLPDGADTIVIQEDTDREGDTVIIKEIESGRHIRPMGQDFRRGDTLLMSPVRIQPRHIGLLSAGDRPWIKVYRRPRVAILSTGDEIVLPGEPRTANQIVSANGPALSAFVKQKGGDPVHLGVVKDDESALIAIANAAKNCDLIVTSGGVSVGDYDLVRKAFGQAGLDVSFHKIAMRPGKPLMFGHLEDTPMLGLPGNPVSALVCALLFLGPALDRLQGLPGNTPAITLAELGSDIKANGDREDYMRAVLSSNRNGTITATPSFAQDSSMIGALANSSALIIRPIGSPAARTGDLVQVLLLDGLL
jgi:molybdopterin molybdotransferase